MAARRGVDRHPVLVNEDFAGIARALVAFARRHQGLPLDYAINYLSAVRDD